MGENEMDDKRPIEKQEPGVVEIDDERQMREREGLAEYPGVVSHYLSGGLGRDGG